MELRQPSTPSLAGPSLIILHYQCVPGYFFFKASLKLIYSLHIASSKQFRPDWVSYTMAAATSFSAET